MAHMGRPFAPYLSLIVFLSCSIDLGSPMVSLGRRSHSWAFPIPAWEGGGPPARGGALFLAPGRVVVVGHTQAMSHLTRRRSDGQCVCPIGQGTSHHFPPH